MSHAYSAKNWLDDFDKTDWLMLIFTPQFYWVFSFAQMSHSAFQYLPRSPKIIWVTYSLFLPIIWTNVGSLFPHFEVVKSAIYQWKRGCHMASKGLKDSQNVQIWPCLYTNRFNSKVATVWAPIVSSFHFTPSSGQTLKGTLNLYYKSIPSIILI